MTFFSLFYISLLFISLFSLLQDWAVKMPPKASAFESPPPPPTEKSRTQMSSPIIFFRSHQSHQPTVMSFLLSQSTLSTQTDTHVGGAPSNVLLISCHFLWEIITNTYRPRTIFSRALGSQNSWYLLGLMLLASWFKRCLYLYIYIWPSMFGFEIRSETKEEIAKIREVDQKFDLLRDEQIKSRRFNWWECVPNETYSNRWRESETHPQFSMKYNYMYIHTHTREIVLSWSIDRPCQRAPASGWHLGPTASPTFYYSTLKATATINLFCTMKKIFFPIFHQIYWCLRLHIAFTFGWPLHRTCNEV